MNILRSAAYAAAISSYLFVSAPANAQTADCFPYKLLVSYKGKITSIDAGSCGSQIKGTYTVPIGPESYQTVRDIAALQGSSFAVYNGTFQPSLTLHNPSKGIWRQDLLPGWSTVNNVSYGGLTTFGNSLYATDMLTGRDTSQQRGIVRFAVDGTAAERFGSDQDYADITTGTDLSDPSGFPVQRLYALRSNGSTVDVVDPDRKTKRSIQLVSPSYADTRGIAVDEKTGDIIAAGWDGIARKYSATGQFKSSLDIRSKFGSTSLVDVDVQGDLVSFGSRCGVVYLADTAFSATQLRAVSFGPIGTCDTTFTAFRR